MARVVEGRRGGDADSFQKVPKKGVGSSPSHYLGPGPPGWALNLSRDLGVYQLLSSALFENYQHTTLPLSTTLALERD